MYKTCARYSPRAPQKSDDDLLIGYGILPSEVFFTVRDSELGVERSHTRGIKRCTLLGAYDWVSW